MGPQKARMLVSAPLHLAASSRGILFQISNSSENNLPQGRFANRPYRHPHTFTPAKAGIHAPLRTTGEVPFTLSLSKGPPHGDTHPSFLLANLP